AVVRRVIDALFDAALRFGGEPHVAADWRPVQAIGILATFSGVFLSGAYAAVYAWFGEPLAAGLAVAMGLLILAVLARVHATRDIPASTFRMATIILVAPLPFHIVLGGFISSSGVVVWSFIAPVFVLVFQDVRRALPWFVAFLAILLASLVVPTMSAGTGLRTGPGLPEGVVLILFGFTLMALAILVFIVLGIFAAQRAAALETAEGERRRADGLLEAILPSSITERLKRGERRIADQYDATVLFADVVGFTALAARLEADELVELLDGLFRRFDELVDRHEGVVKIKTIGDSYMVAVGAPVERHDHAQVAARFALELVDVAARAQGPEASKGGRGHPAGDRRPPLDLRVGMHSGPVIGGVLGRQRPVFDLWGDTVNIASRMESQGVPGRIQISRTTHELLGGDYDCEARGVLEVRGRGRLETWFLLGPREASTVA
ncbi:MAG: hypothetical protein M3472_07125, partial [Chloroflexota bacterium]|nr:hypothetical protein [Chloroflexota bacterium]